MNKSMLYAPTATRCARRFIVAGPAAAGYRPRYICSRNGVSPVAWWPKGNGRRLPAVLPNPSLKRSANGMPPGPVWRYAVHFRQPGPGVLPSAPA